MREQITDEKNITGAGSTIYGDRVPKRTKLISFSVSGSLGEGERGAGRVVYGVYDIIQRSFDTTQVL